METHSTNYIHVSAKYLLLYLTRVTWICFILQLPTSSVNRMWSLGTLSNCISDDAKSIQCTEQKVLRTQLVNNNLLVSRFRKTCDVFLKTWLQLSTKKYSKCIFAHCWSTQTQKWKQHLLHKQMQIRWHTVGPWQTYCMRTVLAHFMHLYTG